jgi:hypothetical protein
VRRGPREFVGEIVSGIDEHPAPPSVQPPGRTHDREHAHHSS